MIVIISFAHRKIPFKYIKSQKHSIRLFKSILTTNLNQYSSQVQASKVSKSPPEYENR